MDRYRVHLPEEDFSAQRERDVKYFRDYLLHENNISMYVDDCRVFMMEIQKTIEEMLSKLKSDRNYVGPKLDMDLDGMKQKIHKWMKENSRMTSALESWQNAPFTHKERHQFRTATELYPRANRGRLLIQRFYLDLTQLPVKAKAQTVVQLLNLMKIAFEN